MLYPELCVLEDEMCACRSTAQADLDSPCHEITQWQCHSPGIDVGLVWPSPTQLSGPVDIMFVGINPNWSLRHGASQEDVKSNKNSGNTFAAYQNHIVSGARALLPAGSHIAYLDLVPCGTPNGLCVINVVNRCRGQLFNKVVHVLKPKVMIAIGRYASEQLYWNDTYSGKKGQAWTGLRKRHATAEHAVFGDHECSVVFALQPSAYVSTERREQAMNAIATAYEEALHKSVQQCQVDAL